MKRWIRILLVMSVLSLVVTLHAQPVKTQPIYVSQVAADTTVSTTVTLTQPQVKMWSALAGYDWISYKAKVDFRGDDINNSCQLFFVNRIDSIIYLNLHVSGVEIIRVVMTPDEVILVNKLDHAYYQGGYDIFAKLGGMNADFYFVQALLNRRDFKGFEDNLQVVEDDATILKFVSPMRRHLTADWSIMQKVEYNLVSGDLQNEITDLMSGRVLTAYYSRDTSEASLPAGYSQLRLTMPIRNMEVTITPKGYKYNVPGPTSIKIPEKFTRLIF